MRCPHRRLAVVLALLGAFAGLARAQTPGLTPITDLGAGTYQGFPGGLYSGGANVPPAAHLAAALARAGQIVPRNAAGAADPDGWIVFIAVGMSNTTHEFAVFERNQDANPARSARVVILDTALGGQTATLIANPSASYWTIVMQRLAAMGLTAAQVQVAWLKEAEAQPPNNFPLHAQALRDTLAADVRDLHSKFPNLQLCYLSSRIYGGYAAQGSLNPEPQAYESGFAVKWLIESQIAGDPGLNYGQLPGPVVAPLLLWGPYLWANGTSPRSDGLVWNPSDLESDHTHPSPSGEQKVAALLGDFFTTDTTAAAWWRPQPGTALVTMDADRDAYVSAANPNANFGTGSLLLAQGGATPLRTYAGFDASGETRAVLLAKLSLRVSTTGGGGGGVSATDDAWSEGAITYASAPAVGAALVQTPQSSRDGTISAGVTSAVAADADRRLSFVLTTANASQQASYVSRDAGQPPRLVLVVRDALAGVPGPGERPGPGLALRSAARNPSAQGTVLAYTLPAAGRVRVIVHDVRGRRVAMLLEGERAAGPGELHWNGEDELGRPVPPGLYLARLEFGAASRAVKLVVCR